MQRTVLLTTSASILAQLVTNAIGVIGLTHDVSPDDEALKTSLRIEMLVQTIEFVFYLWVVRNFNLATMAAARYKDWMVSTPLMLISVMLYYHYEQARQEGRDTTNAVNEFLQRHRQTISIVVVANFLMIAFGYAGEKGWLSMGSSLVLGFVAFGVAFYTMWSRLASKSDMGKRLFGIMASVWSLYGVAFMFPVAAKNIAYNGLDVVAKNFFGLYLSIKVIQASFLHRHGMGQYSYQLLEQSRPDEQGLLEAKALHQDRLSRV